MDEAYAVRYLIEQELMNLSGVVGVSHCNPARKIIVYVEDDEYAEAVPMTLAGIPVEVKVVGKVRILAERVRPIVGGISISPPERIAGTLGIVTYDGKILTNFHVAGIDFENKRKLEKGTPIIQPALVDGGDPEKDVIGYLDGYIDVKEAGNLIDAALVTPVVDYVAGEVKRVGKITGWTDPVVGMTVIKSGRTTGVTRSKVIDVNATMKVRGYPTTKGGVAVFDDVFVVEPAFAMPGDSGSIVVDKNGKVVGLLFAGSRRISVGCKIRHVIDLLNVDLGSYSAPEVVEEEVSGTQYAVLVLMSLLPIAIIGGVGAWQYSQRG